MATAVHMMHAHGHHGEPHHSNGGNHDSGHGHHGNGTGNSGHGGEHIHTPAPPGAGEAAGVGGQAEQADGSNRSMDRVQKINGSNGSSHASGSGRNMSNAGVMRASASALAFGSSEQGRIDMKELQERLNLRAKIRDICVYSVFLVVFSISSVLVVQDQDLYHFGHGIEEQVFGNEFPFSDSHVMKNFDDVATIEELYQWLSGPMYNFLYTGDSFDGNNNPLGYVFGSNKIVGGIRIAQLRLQTSACDSAPNFVQRNNLVCYGDGNNKGGWKLDLEDKSDFGVGPRNFTFNGWGSQFKTVEQARSDSFSAYRTGQGRVYEAPAFAVVLPNANDTLAASLINSMIDGRYIDTKTRIVFIDFTIYNPSMNMFCTVRADAELSKGGGIIVSHSISTVRLYSPFETDFVPWQVLEIVVVAFYLYYIILEGIKIKREGRAYLFRVGTLLHNANLLAYIMMWIMKLVALGVVPPETSVDPWSDVYYDYRRPAMFKLTSVYFNSMNAFLTYFKLVGFLSMVPRYALVIHTLAKAGPELRSFALIFAIVFYGFGAAHMMTFGTRIYGFRNLSQSLFTLLRSLLGDFDLQQLDQAQWFMGPLFFILFVGLAVFVVLNILIAIISDSYEQAVEELADSQDVALYGALQTYMAEKYPGLSKFYKRMGNCCSRPMDAAHKIMPAELAMFQPKMPDFMQRRKTYGQMGADGTVTARRRGSRPTAQPLQLDGVEEVDEPYEDPVVQVLDVNSARA